MVPITVLHLVPIQRYQQQIQPKSQIIFDYFIKTTPEVIPSSVVFINIKGNLASVLGVNAVTKAFNEPPALSDANTTATGVYRTTNSTAHAAGVGIIFAASSGLNIIQLFMKSDNVIYMRVAVGGDFTNANWKEL